MGEVPQLISKFDPTYTTTTRLRFDLTVDGLAAKAAEIIAAMESLDDEIAALAPEAVTWDNTMQKLAAAEAMLGTDENVVDFPQHVSSDKAVRDASMEAAKALQAAR